MNISHTRCISRYYHDKMKTNLVKNTAGPENSFLVVEHILVTSLTSEELVKVRMVLDMFKTFIRSGESGSSKCERCFIIRILVFSSALFVACSSVFEYCSCIFVGLFMSSCRIFFTKYDRR